MPDIITIFEEFHHVSDEFKGFISKSKQTAKLANTMAYQDLDIHPLDKADVRAAVENYCPGYTPKDRRMFPVIYRGTNYTGDAYIVNPSSTKRTSKNAVNSIYNLILGTFEGYPNRLESFIASLDRGYAGSYGTGDTYVLVPKAGSVIGVCAEDDVYNSFALPMAIYEIESLGDLAYILHQMLRRVQVQSNTLLSLDAVKSAFAKLDGFVAGRTMDELEYATMSRQEELVYEDMKKSGQPLYDILRNLLDPDKAGFQSFEYGRERLDVSGIRHEVWTSGTCIMVREDVFNEQYG